MSRLGIWAIVHLGAVAVAQVEYQPAEAYSIDGNGRPFPGLALTLSAEKAVFRQGEEVTVTANLRNRSNRHIAISYKEGVFPYLISVDRQTKGGGPIFDPVSKTATGERVLNPNIVPRSANIRNMPPGVAPTPGYPICVSCLFDLSQAGKYRIRIAKVLPFPLTVRGPTQRAVSNEVLITVAP